MTLTPRQLRVLEIIREYIRSNGYAPTLAEISRTLAVSTVTAFEHVQALQRKGAIRREKHKTRSIEICDAEPGSVTRVRRLPLVGRIAAGSPIEALPESEDVDITELIGATSQKDLFLLSVRGDSMIDEHIRDGDYVIVERRDTAANGETVVALVNHDEVTLKKFYREGGRVRLQPANEAMKPIYPNHIQIQGVVVGVLRKY